MRVKWKEMDEPILRAIQNLEANGFKEPTIRAVYYVLGNVDQLIPLVEQGYKGLDAKIVEMRKEGKIPWGFFAVKRGTADETGMPVPLPDSYSTKIPYTAESPEAWADKWAEHWVAQTRRAADSFSLPRWFGQDELVEVWVEKDGLLGATSNWLSDLEVTVRAPQGYGAWEFVHDAMKKIRRELKEQRKKSVTILYAGDLDPSGKDIPRFMHEEAIAHFQQRLGIPNLEFKELALSPEQVRQYGLPEEPEAEEVRAKISRDSRLRWYLERYPQMFCELDAFYALATEAARTLIRDAVISRFSERRAAVRERQESAGRERVQELIAQRVEFLED